MSREMWDPAAPPDGYEGPCFRKGNVVAASRPFEHDTLQWHLFHFLADGKLEQMPGMWIQLRAPGRFEQTEFEQALDWADQQISTMG